MAWPDFHKAELVQAIEKYNQRDRSCLLYTSEDTYEAGIALAGTEVKSLRMGKCSIKESFVRIQNGEVYIYGMNTVSYTHLHMGYEDQSMLCCDFDKLRKELPVQTWTPLGSRIDDLRQIKTEEELEDVYKRQMYVTICGRFCLNESAVAGYGN